MCAGDNVSLEAEIFTDQDRLDIYWSHGDKNIINIPQNDQHFTVTKNSNKTVLGIHNALPSHDSIYSVYGWAMYDFAINMITLEVHGKIIFY